MITETLILDVIVIVTMLPCRTENVATRVRGVSFVHDQRCVQVPLSPVCIHKTPFVEKYHAIIVALVIGKLPMHTISFVVGVVGV
jgi:hypothetical protein